MQKINLFLIFISISFHLLSQNPVKLNNDVSYEFSDGSINLFDQLYTDDASLTHNPNNTIFFQMRENVFHTIKEMKPCSFDLNIPFINNETISVSMEYFTVVTENFQVVEPDLLVATVTSSQTYILNADQIIGSKKTPFSDQETIREVIGN